MVDHEFEPTDGPAPYIGAGALTAVGGGSLAWIGATRDAGTVALVLGIVIAVVGLAVMAIGLVRLRGEP